MATFESLHQHQYINLTTFRRNGTPVTTPVWFALHEGKLHIMTPHETGKVKRLRNRADVAVAPSTALGKTTGPEQPGKAYLRPLIRQSSPYQALEQKYGWQIQLIRVYHRLRRSVMIMLEVEPA